MFGRRQNNNALDPPPVAVADPHAMKVLRVWALTGDAQQVVLRTTWDDPGAWGLLLVDVTRHVANAYANKGADPNAVLRRIRELFDAEWTSPTDVPRQIFGD